MLVGRKSTPPSSSSTSEALGFSDPGLQNLDMAAGSGGLEMAGVAGGVGEESGTERKLSGSVHWWLF